MAEKGFDRALSFAEAAWSERSYLAGTGAVDRPQRSRCEVALQFGMVELLSAWSRASSLKNAPRLRRLESDAAKDLYCACGTNKLAQSLPCTEDLIFAPRRPRFVGVGFVCRVHAATAAARRSRDGDIIPLNWAQIMTALGLRNCPLSCSPPHLDGLRLRLLAAADRTSFVAIDSFIPRRNSSAQAATIAIRRVHADL